MDSHFDFFCENLSTVSNDLLGFQKKLIALKKLPKGIYNWKAPVSDHNFRHKQLSCTHVGGLKIQTYIFSPK